MASMNPSDGTAHAPKSILTLEISEETFPAQIETASSILEVDLRFQWEEYMITGNFAPSIPSADPRPAYTLKWLLKKLQYTGGTLNIKAWVLLRVLLVRTPLAKVARLLKEYRFTDSLRKTLEALYKYSTPKPGCLRQKANFTGSLTDSSLNTVDGSLSDSGPSKKRKRGNTPSDGSVEPVSEGGSGLRMLYLAVCGVIEQIEELCADSENGRGFPIEHLRFATRSFREEAAAIFGYAIYVANHIIRDSGKGLSTKVAFPAPQADTADRSCVISVAKFWNGRARGRPGISDDMNNREFRRHCTISSLHLLTTIRARLDSDGEAVAEVLEDLLIRHVISPFRTRFLDKQRLYQPQIEDTSGLLGTDLVSALKLYHFPLPGDERLANRSPYDVERSTSKIKMHLMITFLSLLFKVALRSFPRSTPNQRRVENPWLEDLFKQLTDCAAILIPHASPKQAQRDYSRLVTWMLQHCVDCKLGLRVSTMQYVLDNASNLFAKGHDHIDWDMISLCLVLEANVFTIPASSTGRDEHYGYRTPNKYLFSLLSKLTAWCQDASPEEYQRYDFVVAKIVTPLCDAFSDVRDLTGFLGHWREQLDKIQKRQDTGKGNGNYKASVWEDDKLMNRFALLAGSTLTSGQLDQILNTAAGNLITSVRGASEEKNISLSSLVVIDCTSAGAVQEGKLVGVDETVQSMYSMVGTLLAEPPSEMSIHRWRLWKIQAAIATRWTWLHESPTFKRISHSAICVGLELFRHVPFWGVVDNSLDLTEHYYAFKFLFCFANMDDHHWDGLQFSSCEKVRLGIEKLLDVLEPFCNRISHDFFETGKFEGAESSMNISASRIKSLDSLYLQCMSHIIACPSDFSYFDETLVGRLIEQIYWCAVYQQHSSKNIANAQVDYSTPWQMLVRRDSDDVVAKLTKCLRDFQVQHYLKISSFGDPRFWDKGTADYQLAFQSVQQLSPSTLEPEQRSKLANRILRILLRANMSSLAEIRDHLAILAGLVTFPNQSMDVLIYARDMSYEKSKRPNDELILVTLARGVDGSMKWSCDNMQCVDTLQQLTRLMMRYLFSTLDQQKSKDYLNDLYDRLARFLEDKYRNGESCTTAISSLVEVSLNLFSQHRNKISFKTLDLLRQYHLEIILKGTGNIGVASLTKPENRHYCGVCLDSLVGYSDLLIIHPQLREITSQLSNTYDIRVLSDKFNTADSQLVGTDVCSLEYLAVRLARLELVLGSYDSVLHPSLMSAGELLIKLQTKTHRIEKEYLLRYTKDTISYLGLQSKKEFLRNFDPDRKTHLNQSELLLLKLLVSSLRENELEGLGSMLSRVIIVLCAHISMLAPIQESALAVQCINIFLQKHPRVISQWHIDSLIACITIKSSRLENSRDKNDSTILYNGLCRILSTILLLHRSKTGGRYHLLLPALQSLLRCLFTPYISSGDASAVSPSAFESTDASNYARLLTTLADPTVSSVTRSMKHSRHNLNDETKKARSIAGQHLPYLIMEYCACQLKERLAPEMKKALEPGLYAVLSDMTIERMRTMNAALDEGGRAVWKALYEDWRRFGG